MNKKRTIFCILGMLAVILLGGCARFDAAMYVQAVLDTKEIRIISDKKELPQESRF